MKFWLKVISIISLAAGGLFAFSLWTERQIASVSTYIDDYIEDGKKTFWKAINIIGTTICYLFSCYGLGSLITGLTNKVFTKDDFNGLATK